MRRFILTLSLVFAAVLCSSAINYPDVKCGPWVQNVSETGFTVMWTSSHKNLAYVEIAPDDGTPFELCDRPRFYNLVAGRRVADSLHTVKITGLEPGKAYRYRIYAKVVEDDESAYGTDYGPEYRTSAKKDAVIRTLDSGADKCRFFMMNDIHNKAEKYQALAKGVDREKFDFFLMNGDMTSYINNLNDMIRDVFNTVPDLTSSIATVYARGNHETRGREAHLFSKVCPTATGQPYFMFRQGPVAFLILDGGEDKPDSAPEYSGTVDFDSYRAAELEWIKEVVKNPIVTMRFLNARVTVLGEVKNPGTYTLNNGRMTLLEALGIAGDLTQYASRRNVLVTRENNGKVEFARLDLRSDEVFTSPYFYLQQNDVVYVEPNSARTTSNQSISLWLSMVGTVASAATVVVSVLSITK